MKKILLVLFLLSSICATAQNYQCLQPGVKRYFTNANGYLRGMRIDSVGNSGTDIIYYPFHTPRGAYPYWVGAPSIAPFDSTGGSWLGKTVIQKSDGTFLFDNIWQDTVVIKTQAHVGDTWVLYNDTTKRFYQAYLAAEDTMTVLGMIDTVKVITIMAYDDTGYVPADSINKYQLIISKNNGFVKTFDLHTFPYHPPGNVYNLGYDYYLDVMWNYSFGLYPFSAKNVMFSIVPFVNATWMQLYDRNPGDEYEYHTFVDEDYHLYNASTYWLDSVYTRSFSPDSLLYNYRGWIAVKTQTTPAFIPGYPYPYTFQNINNDRSYYNLPVIDTGRMPEECGNTQLLYYSHSDTSYAMISRTYRFIRNDLVGNSWDPGIHFERSGPDRTFKIGLGLTHYQVYDAGSDRLYDSSLIYYKKGSLSFGTYVVPVNVSVAGPANSGSNISVYPSPAANTITVTSTGKISCLVITNITGTVIFDQPMDTKEISIDVERYPPGIYFLRINGSEIRKFIKN